MDNNFNSQNQTMQQRPMLRKVKRPINRTPQAPVEASGSVSQQTNLPQQKVVTSSQSSETKPQVATAKNPFLSSQNTDDAFNLDSYLDEKLPTQRHFLGEEEIVQDQKSFASEDTYEDDFDPMTLSGTTDLPPYLTKKVLVLLGILVFFIGIVTTKIFFGEEKVIRNGLQGVVVNPEVPKGRARCGVAERTQGCILYLMNPQRREIPAKDFYDLAAQLTGRQRFVIETGNMRYSNIKIRPGDIAQFNIPPL